MKTTKEIIVFDEYQYGVQLDAYQKKLELELAYTTSQLSSIQSRQKSSLMNYDQSLYALDDIQSDLTKKYDGEFKINLETGELIREDVINS